MLARFIPFFSGSLFRGGLWVAAGRCLGISATILINAVLARQLTHQDFGFFLLIRSIASFGAVCSMFGLESVLVRVLGESFGLGDTARARAAIALSLPLLLAAMLIVSVTSATLLGAFGRSTLGLPVNLTLLILIVAMTVLFGILQLSGETLRGMSEISLASFISGANGGAISNALLIAGVLILPFAFPADLRNVLIINDSVLALAASFAAIRLMVLFRSDLDDTPNLSRSSHLPALSTAFLLSTCLPVLGSQILTFLVGQADLWIGGGLLGADQLAIYGAARRLTFIVALPLDLLNMTIVSSIPRLYARGELIELQHLLRRSTQLAVLPALATVLILVVAPTPVLTLFYGDSYRDAANPLVVLSLGQLVFSWCGACGITLMMTGQHRVMLVINVFCTVTLVIAGVVGARISGVMGLAIACTAVTVVQRLAMWFCAGRLVGLWTHASTDFRFRLNLGGSA